MQFSRSLLSIGYVADEKNIINSNPINSNLMGGLSEEDFFISAQGSRKGIVDKQSLTPLSGYLERSLTMALSVIEIDEDDCGTQFGFPITISNSRHAKSLVGKYFKNGENWIEFLPSDKEKYIGKELIFRSPITCFTDNFKICRKCFGNYERIKTPYVGIISGQVIAERTTQLSMRSFHTSGSSTLQVNNDLKTYIKSNIIDIELDNNSSTLIFKENILDNMIQQFQTLPGYISHSENTITYENVFDVPNEDVGKVIQDLRNCLLTEIKKNVKSIELTYAQLIGHILSVGDMFSTFIEIVLCNLYTDENDIIIRYQLKEGRSISMAKKYSIFHVHSLLSPTLNLLYKPNLKTIEAYYNNSVIKNNYKPSIFEKIWLNL